MKQRVVKRLFAGLLAISVIASGGAVPSVSAAEPEGDAQWEEIESIINSFSDKARWTSPNYGNVYSDSLPDSALLGNGNTGITSAGDETSKTYVIADGGFWSDNSRTFGYSNGRSPQLIAGGGITISPVEGTHEYNLAYGGSVTASSEKEGYSAQRAVNGAYTRNPDQISEPFTGWEAAEEGPQSLILDMEFAQSFDRYVIKHDNATSGLGSERNTDSFKVQILEEGIALEEAGESDWITVDEVTGNTDDVTDRKLKEAVRTRYVRLLIEKPTAESGDNLARISQFELYNGEYDYSMPIEDNAPSEHEYNLIYGMPVTASSGQDTAALAVGGAYQYTDASKEQKFEGWVSEIGQEQYLMVDLKAETKFNRWTVKHNNMTAGNGADLNTSDYSLEYSHDAETWITADTVTGNTADETDRKLFYTPTARYVRLHITKPSQESEAEGRARISQFELYCDDNYGESIATPDNGASVTASSNPYNNVNNIIDNTWYKDKSGVNDYSGWISVHAQMPQWAQIDLGADKTFDEWAIVHSGNEMLVQDLYASGNETADHHSSFPTGYRRFNPRDFKVSYRAEADEEWTVLEEYKGNTSGLSSEMLEEPVTARYIRIDYTTGEQYKPGTTTVDTNQRARIAKFYLFNNAESSFYTMPVEDYPAADEAARTVSVAAYAASISAAAVSAQNDFLEQLDIAKAEINTDMTLGEVPVSMNTWLYPNEDILVTRLTSQGDQAQVIEVDVWGKEKLASLTPASNVDLDKTHPLAESLSGVDGEIVWGSRTSNVADDVMKDGTVHKARWMSEIAMASRVIGGENAAFANSKNEGKIRVTVPAGETVTIVTGIHCEENQEPDAENGAEGLAVQKAIDKITEIDTEEEVSQLYEEHLKWWQDYYKLSYADFGDKNLNRLYYGSQYLFACCTREGETAPGLYGVWANNDRMKWQGDYHLNYNFQAPYYGSYSSNRLREFSQPLFEVIARNIDKGLASAADPDCIKSIESTWYWDTREDLHNGIQDAVLYPVGIKQYDVEFSSSYLNQTMNALFLASQVLSYYRYTLDEEWLFEEHKTPEGNSYTLYDFLVYDANFYAKWIEKKGLRIDEEYIKDSPAGLDGHALTKQHSRNYTEKYPDYTEEMGDDYCYVLYDGAHEGSFDFNPSVITGGVKNLMEGLLEIGKEHAPSQEKYETWQDIADHIVGPEVTIFTRNGKEIFGLSEDRGIRSISAPVNMEFVHPGDQLGFDSDPYLLEVGRNTMDQANWGSVNSTPKAPTMAARVQYDPDQLVSKINTYVVNKMRANYYVDDNTHGWEKVGVLEALNNMMVQSDGGIIKVFPVWRDNYNGKFSTIREKGAFLVSSEMKNNTVQYVELTSEKGTDAKLVNPWGSANVTVTDSNGNKVEYTKGTTVNSGENTIEFQTQENMTYRITEGGVDKTDLEDLYNQYKEESSTGYVKETWEALQSALKQAENVLNSTEASQEEVDAVYADLQEAAANLRVSKTTLEYFLNSAKEHVAAGDTEGLVESVRKLFDEAIAEGESVMADENATKDEVTNAAIKLMKAIQALDFKAGDKTDLEMALELAQAIDLTKYVEAGQAEYLAAKETAENVMADGDAMQDEVDTAWDALIDAMSGLRLKADKAALQELMDSLEGLDLSLYTEESVQVYSAAFARANVLLADMAVSIDEQGEVDAAVKALTEAKELLVLKEENQDGSEDDQNPGTTETPGEDSQNPDDTAGTPDADNGGNSGQEDGNTNYTGNTGSDSGNSSTGNSSDSAVQKAAKTGDSVNPALWVMILAAGAVTAGAVSLKKKKYR